MLPFDTAHALTGCLIDADAHAETLGWDRPPVLFMVIDQPLTAVRQARQRREMSTASLHLDRGGELATTAHLPQLLHGVARILQHKVARAYHPAAGHHGDRPGAVWPGALLVAWAVLYEDIAVDAGDLRQIRRLDAVDTDGRVYQLTRRYGGTHPDVSIDDRPDPGDLPATQPGLAALIAATQHPTAGNSA